MNATVFRMEDKIGSIEVGKRVDIIVVDRNPDKDTELLSASEKITLVMKKGEVFRNIL